MKRTDSFCLNCQETKAEQKAAFVFVLILAFLPVMAVVAPRFLAYGPAFAGLFLYLWQGLSFRRWPRPHRLATLSAGAVTFLAAASALWSVDPAESLERAGKLCLVLFPATMGLSAIPALDRATVTRWLWLVPASVALCYSLIYIELLFDMPLYRFFNHIPRGEFANSAALNRPAVTATLCLFTALAILKRRRHTAEIGALVLLSLLVFTLNQSQSAVLAFVCGLIFFSCAPAGRCWFQPVLFLLTTALLLWSPLLAINMLDMVEALENSTLGSFFSHSYAAERLEIWSFIAQHILEKPWFGYGIEATRNIENFNAAQIYYRSTTVLHPHNFALQIWIEFGLIGALCACALLGKILDSIHQSRNIRSMRTELATLYASMAVAAVGYGLWQGWWLGLMTLLLYLCALLRLTED
ncbi:MAG: O-antigen ligase family protein [Micavibrio aeruginosavorus]|uniref:O-antigen ligase family protein n=1 Tax=Micavibrio aeruginosavorus TaxID=349221 RepID=A0A7T5R2S8_9BACT|nr:MAG: O-antigen ligase family protein [Micavibrio aeruginosavorus]